MSNTPLLVDKALLEFTRLAPRGRIDQEARKVWRDLDGTITRQVPRCPAPYNLPTTGPEIASYLDTCRTVVEEKVLESASHYSKRQWLWYLRRIPPDVLPAPPALRRPLGPPNVYDLSLAEAATALAGAAASSSLRPDGYSYRLDEHVVRRVLRFSASIRYLSQIQFLIRHNGRNVPLTFKSGSPLPVPASSGPELEAFEALRVRLKTNSMTASALPTRAGIPFGHLSDTYNLDTHFFKVMRDLNPRPYETPDNSTEAGETEHFRFALPIKHFHLSPVKVDALMDFCDATHSVRGAHLETVFIDLLSLLKSLDDLLGHQNALASVFTFGYIMAPEREFDQAMNSAWQWATSWASSTGLSRSALGSWQDARARLLDLPACLWPVRRGTPLRCDRGFISVDYYAAAGDLVLYLNTVDRQGGAANARGRSFELQVQDAIDGSPCKVDDKVRDLRGRPLTLCGEAISDIDALGTVDNILLIVSCKARAYDEQLEIAHYNSTRNSVSMLREAVLAAQELAKSLCNSKVGDNYDLSGFSDVRAIVCTPMPLLTPIELLRAEVFPGLPVVVSLPEFRQWLDQLSVP